ncbi:thioredoxin [Candidatus Berkelbacteria bacterium CG10_big_fil_rev_8_21_14_0_10_41_12]|uniref:Thioredoxin n=1 Tax=Candidatus Berkelbacteria bacterium CG10_big_fil_rev_8_21_14_0_10_41_12 TaxID=1974513 RepID=A0A2M6WXQ4_9BACT|nr:MAG: thioredoxin [Candidatus Berkelbacteria bacterium CG10_big_fil_rev_8_21_14_0_10_41_12]
MSLEITGDKFDEVVLKSDLPVLADFYANWCGPCQQIAPILEELSDEMKNKIKIVKIDVEKNPVLANKFQVMAIPTMFIFKDGKPAKTIQGFSTKETLKKEIKDVI